MARIEAAALTCKMRHRVRVWGLFIFMYGRGFGEQVLRYPQKIIFFLLVGPSIAAFNYCYWMLDRMVRYRLRYKE